MGRDLQDLGFIALLRRNAQLRTDTEGTVDGHWTGDQLVIRGFRPRGDIDGPVHGVNIAVHSRYHGVVVVGGHDRDGHLKLDALFEVGVGGGSGRCQRGQGQGSQGYERESCSHCLLWSTWCRCV